MTDQAVIQRLDTIIAILRFAHSDAIGRVRDETRKDAVNASILDLTANGFVPIGQLKKSAGKSSGQSERTVQRRIGELLDLGALEVDGGGKAAMYRSTGLL